MEFNSSPKRPYLLRAYYDWVLDNGFTPYLVVDATYYGVDVPQEYVKDGQIVLNLSEGAVGNLALGNDAIEFSARFQGISRNLYIPMGAAMAIYARENGDGVMFEPEPVYDELDKRKFYRKEVRRKNRKKNLHRKKRHRVRNPPHICVSSNSLMR